MVNAVATLTRISIADLTPKDGAPSETYKNAVNSLWASLARSNAAIIQLTPGDEALMKYALDSARVYFQHKPRSGPDLRSLSEDPNEWNRTSGYFAEPHFGKENYDYRPGKMPPLEEDGSVPPSCMPEAFTSLGSSARIVLEAVARSLDLRSHAFGDLLDNMPLKINEVASSVLSACCHGRRPSTGAVQPSEQRPGVPEDSEPRAEKGLLTLMKGDRPGLYIRDPQNRWILVDADLGPADVLVLTGLSLYQATGGYVGPALYKTDLTAAAAATAPPPHMFAAPPSLANGRCSLVFKLMARGSAIIHCSAMAAAGHQIAAPFQAPVAVQGFMMRAVPLDQIIATPPKGPKPRFMEKIRKRKSKDLGEKGLAPSKRLRLEAQRVLKEKVQDLAELKQLKIRFCTLKDCEEQHMHMEDPPCAYLRSQLGWPPQVPFVHPHDLPNRGKQSFLEAFEPGWTQRQGVDMPNFELGATPKRGSSSSAVETPPKPLMVLDKYSLKTIYDFLRENAKPVPTGKPQVVGHKVDLPLLCRYAAEAGGREQFEIQDGFQRFITETFNLEHAPEKEKERALERLKKLYDQVLDDYVEHLVMSTQTLDDGNVAGHIAEQLTLEDGNIGTEMPPQVEQAHIGEQLEQGSSMEVQLEENKWAAGVDTPAIQLGTAEGVEQQLGELEGERHGESFKSE